MPTTKITPKEENPNFKATAKWVNGVCIDLDHNPPITMPESGEYEHVCPNCGNLTVFTFKKGIQGI